MKAHISFLLTMLALGACGGYNVPDSRTSPEQPTWDNSVHEIMDNHCTRCHGANPDRGASGEFRLDVYQSDSSYVGAGDMAEEIVDSIGDEMPPEGTLGSNDTKTLKKWLADGAPER